MINQNTSSPTMTAVAPLPPVYFDPASRQYFLRNKFSEWMNVSHDTAESFVVTLGFDRATSKNQPQSDAEKIMLRVQLENCVHYAGPLAGYKVGPHVIGTTRVLVTKPVQPVSPAPGNWPILRELLTNLFGDEQLVYLLGWIKQTLAMLTSGKHRPGQALCICGPVNAGKSLISSVFTALFGGEPGHPWRYMNGKTEFNSDLFGSVLLLIDDAAESTDHRTRRAFGANIKQMVAVRSQPCHKKYGEQISLQPLWRLMIMLNDDPERLMVLPPLDADIEDKLMLFKVEARTMPMPTDTPEEAEALMDTLRQELPAFVHYLEGWTVPPGHEHPRYGIDRYHHPEIARDLDITSPEARLKEMIDEVIFGSVKAELRPEPWEGKAVELERLLADRKSPCSREAERLLPAGGAVCGKYLGRLAKQDARFTQRQKAGLSVWTIQPPVAASATASASDFRDKLEANIRAISAANRSPAVALLNHDGGQPDDVAGSESTERSGVTSVHPIEPTFAP